MGLLQQMDPHFREHPVRNTHTIEVKLDGTNRRLQLPDNTLVQDKHIYGMSVRRKLTGSKSSTGRTLADDSIIDAAFITIRSGQTDTLRDYPVAYLSKKADGGADAGNYTQVSIPNGYVANSSHIQIADGVSMTPEEVIEITFHYLFPNDCDTNPL